MLLQGKSYDPATAVSLSCASLLAMTAIDTTNLSLTFTGPANGTVLVRLEGTVHGGSATPWFPMIMLGVLEGSTVKGRQTPKGYPQGLVGSATTMLTVEALFLVAGLTPGTSYTWNAAYGVEVSQAGAGLKYGGPNNTTTNDAFGAFLYEIWDTA